MKALRRVLRAGSVREALSAVPDAFYERFALVVLAAWIIVPLPLWWLGAAVGNVRLLEWIDLQVGVAALVLIALLAAARWAGAGLVPARDLRRDNLPLALFGVFLALALVATIVNPTPAAWEGDGYRRESILTYIAYVGFFLLATQVLAVTRRTLVLALVLGLVLVTCAETLVTALVEGWGSGDWSGAIRSIAYFHQFNHYGYLLAVGGGLAASGALIATRRTARAALLVAFGVILLTLLMNDTLGAYIALAVGSTAVLVWLAVLHRLRARHALALVGMALAVHVLAELVGVGMLGELASLGSDVRAVSEGTADAASAGTGRWGLWVTTLEQIAARPWLGHGIEGIAHLLRVGFGRPHNEYAQYAAFFGIPALLAYLGALAVVFVRVARRGAAVDAVTVCAATGAATYLVSAFFGNTMYYTAPLLFVLLGLVWAGVRRAGVDAPVTPAAEERDVAASSRLR